ncbi:MAG: heme utilization cystosolic carrier protein HutX [Pseudolabrys sp.]
MTEASVNLTLRDKLAADPGAVFESVAKEYHATVRQVVDALPGGMRRYAPAEAFVDVMTEVGAWGEVTVIVHTDDGIMEFTGPVPAGKIAQNYYNIPGRTGFHGHLRPERCSGIAFVERPFFGRPSASILFFNLDGGTMFKIFVGRDGEARTLSRSANGVSAPCRSALR